MALRSGAVGDPKGFSLVELLVALALLSVVVMLMGLLMNSLRINSEVLLAGFSDVDPAENGRSLDADLRMLLRSQPDEDIPVLALDDDNVLAWRRLFMDDRGRERPAEVLVMHNPDQEAVFRIVRPAAGEAVTNVVWRGVSRVDWTFWDEEEWHTVWPPGEQGDVIPRMVRAEVKRGEDRLRHDMLIPAAMRLEPEEE